MVQKGPMPLLTVTLDVPGSTTALASQTAQSPTIQVEDWRFTWSDPVVNQVRLGAVIVPDPAFSVVPQGLDPQSPTEIHEALVRL
jgi:hypothetical protein